MTEQNHNFEIETALLHFKSAFDDTVINRYSHEDSSSVGIKGNVQQKIKVNYVFGPKQRILADLEGKTDTVKFPIVAICPTGMGRDDQRVKNKNDNLRFRLPDGSYGNYQIVPWNINVSMSIMAKFQEDVTQIISNFAVMSNPYIIFSWREPKTGREVNAEVFWDGQVAMEYPGANADLPPNTPFRVMATANFVIKTYLYRTAIENTANICKINTDIVTTKNFYCDYESLVAETADNDRDSYEILGKPQLRYVNDWYFRTGQTPKIIVQGDGFALTDAVFVSGSNPDMYTLSSYEYYGNRFKGQMVPEFEIVDAQTLSFVLPSPSALGFADIIVVNECGIGQLTVDADRCSRVENPYKTSQIEYYEWQVLQFPYLNGLIISNELNGGYVIDYNQDIVYYTECYDDGTTIDIPLSALLESDTRTVSCQPKITVQRIASPDYDHQTLSYDEETYTLTISGGNSISLSALNSVTVAETDPLFTAWLQTSATSLLTVGVANNIFVSLTGGVINGGLSATSLSADTLYVRDNTIYFIDGSDNIIETLNSDDVALFKDASVSFNSNSADWDNITSTLQTNSSVWDSVYNTVNSNSSVNWNYQGTDIKALTSDWDSSYITVQTNSAVNWNYQGVDIKSLTGAWDSSYITVQTNSAINWNYQGTDIKSLTANWESAYINFNSQSANNISVYNTVASNSANWEYQGIDVKSLTSNWESVYNTVNDNSATTWNYQGTDIKTLTGNWDSSYNTVNSNSANWDYQGTDIKALTSNWENTYTTVRANSSYCKSAFQQFSIVDNFIGAIQCNGRAGGTGSSVGVGSGTHLLRPAVLLTTGTTTTGNAQLIERSSGSLQAWIKGAASLFMQWAMVPSALSDGTDTYTIRAGLEQNNLGSVNDGVFFRYTHSVNSGNWQAVTRASSVETVTNTTVANTTASYTKFKIEINSAGTSVVFSINDVVVATHTTNIPTQGGYLLGLIKSAGSTSRILYISPFEYLQTLNIPY